MSVPNNPLLVDDENEARLHRDRLVSLRAKEKQPKRPRYDLGMSEFITPPWEPPVQRVPRDLVEDTRRLSPVGRSWL